MRVLPFLFLVCALPLRPARAQVAAKEAPSTPIRYSRDVPQSVLKLMPRGAKSLFWGKFSPKKGSGLMAVHLFNRNPKESSEVIIHSLQADLFFRRKRQWQKVNRVPVDYMSDFGGTVETVNARFFWIDRQKTIPMLKLLIFTAKGFNGDIGDEIAVAFPHGFRQKAAVQSWVSGTWISSTSMGETLDWSQRDSNGFLRVVVTELNNDEFNRYKRTLWHWRNGEFSPVLK